MTLPYRYICGDFNGRPTEPITDAFQDIQTLDSPPTRRDNFLDLIITNLDTRDLKMHIPPWKRNEEIGGAITPAL